jgi:predicted dehydrogenase/nucleoside-diphosphate-sugar epimerase
MTIKHIFRVGLVGAGYICDYHIAALKRIPNARIVGITDIDQERARSVAQKHRLSGVFPSLKMMASEGLDVVHVLTPPNTHAQIAIEALQLGCHVLVEKPLATSVEDCDRIAEAAKQAGKVVCVNHSLLRDPFVLRALKLVRSGKIGEVLAVDYFRSSDYPPYRGGPLPPQYHDGGYPFRDLGVHALYLLQEFLGEIQDVQAEFHNAGKLSRDPNIHFDEWRALVRCARGTANIQLSWNVTPLQHQLFIQGTRGTIRADMFSMFVTSRRNTPLPKAIERATNAMLEAAQIAVQVPFNVARFLAKRLRPYHGLQTLIAEFYRNLSEGKQPPVTIAQARSIVGWTEQVARDADHAKAKLYGQYRSSKRPAVVVTGANGQIGRALVRRLIDEDEFVRVFVRRLPPPEIRDHPQVEVVLGELGDPQAVDEAIENATAVFHLGAATSGGWPAHEAATITGTRNVVNACLKHKVPKLIYMSSLAVIDTAGHRADQAVTESSPLEPAAQQRGYYTQAKLEAERIVRAAVEERGLPAVILRPGQVWSEDGQLLTPAVGIRMGNRLIMIGDGEMRLPLIHVNDVIEAVVLATQSKFHEGEIFHFVDNETMSREELARLYVAAREPQLRITRLPLGVANVLAKSVELLAKILRRPPPISPYRLRSALAPLAFDCSRARKELGWQPKTKSRTALKELLKPNSA